MNKLQKKQAALARRHRRVRGKISGTPERPRLCVTRSNNNIYVQFVDDVAGKTLCGVSTWALISRPRARTALTSRALPLSVRSQARRLRNAASRKSFSIVVATCTMGASRLWPTLLVKPV